MREHVSKNKISADAKQKHTPISNPHQSLDAPSSKTDVLHLQRTIGNQATQHLLSSQPSPTPSVFPQLRMATQTSNLKIQRTPLSDLEDALAQVRKDRLGAKSSNQKKRLNAKIRKLEQEISTLKESESAEETVEEAVPEADPTPFSTKYPTLKGAYKESDIENLESSLGEPRLIELVKAFTGEDIQAQITSLGVPKYKDLISALNNNQMGIIINSLTLPKVKSLLETFSATEIKTHIGALNPDKFKSLVTTFDEATYKKLIDGITLPKVADLIGTFSATIIKAMYDTLGADILKDVLSEYTAVALKQFMSAVGGNAKFIELTKTRKLPATALKKYGASFLKSFVGADNATINHLLSVYTRSDNGVISGGHDESVFYPELDKIIGSYTNDDDEEVTVYNGLELSVQEYAMYDVVQYKTFTTDGYNFGSGLKTLIHNLNTDKAKWLVRANEAAWSSIKDETFNKDGDSWSGVSSDGTYIKGFLANAGKRLATFFPY